MNSHHLYAQGVAARYAALRAEVKTATHEDLIDAHWRRPLDTRGDGRHRKEPRAKEQKERKTHKRRREW